MGIRRAAKKLGSAVSSVLGRILGRPGKPKTPPRPKKPRVQTTGGHRGVAVRSIADKYLAEARDWQTVTNSEVQEFIYKEKIFPVNSSNVVAAQYFYTTEKMIVEFDGGGVTGVYEYSNVTEEEALSFARAFSKGAFCWDYFRVRGSKTAHRKPYRKLA